jgi:hypothetical protein
LSHDAHTLGSFDFAAPITTLADAAFDAAFAAGRAAFAGLLLLLFCCNKLESLRFFGLCLLGLTA